MAATAGYKCLLQIGGTPTTITGITSAEISIGQDIFDITDLNNNTWKLKLAGLADYTLKLSGNFDLSDAEQTVLQNAILTSPGATTAWRVYPVSTGFSGTHYYSGNALVKTFAPKFDVKSEEQVSIDLEGTGAISYT